jgi:arylsulfatase A-like enzyme
MVLEHPGDGLDKPNILVIWGDDIGTDQHVSAYTQHAA